LLDDTNNLINDPFHYRDDRTDNIPEKVFEEISKEDLYKLTGIQTLQFNTIFQLFCEFRISSIANAKVNKFLLIPDYLNFLLSNEIFAEYTIVSTTGLTDQNSRDWNWEIIESLEYDKNIFPPIVQPGTIIGNLIPSISEQTRLKPTLPIIAAAGHDTASAVASVPSKEKPCVFLSSGTWSIMGVEVEKPVLTDLAMKYDFSNEGGVEGTIRFLKNIIGLWPIQECRRTWLQDGEEYSYVELTKCAEEFGYANGWLDLNDLRFLKSGDMPNKIIEFMSNSNQKYSNNIGNLVRIILESLAFKYRIVFQEIELIIQSKIIELNAIGGGIQNELLCQLTADALNIPVVAGPIEGTIIGNIGVQAIATNSVENLKSWRGIVENSFELKTYLPQNPEYFNENENKYKDICGITD